MISYVFGLIFGALELVINLVVSVLASGGSKVGRRESRVDWVRVFVVFTGVVALLLLALFVVGLVRDQGLWS